MTGRKVNCLLDFILVIFYWFWFPVVTLVEFMEIILAVGCQQCHVKSFLNVTVVRVAAEFESVFVALVVILSNWERSQPSWLYLFVAIGQVNVSRR